MKLDYLKGIRFDFTNEDNVTIEIDYIKFVNNTDIQFAFFEGFDDDSYLNYSYANANYLKSNSRLIMTGALDKKYKNG